jgi:DNA-binding CsgD family transcriptional regulator
VVTELLPGDRDLRAMAGFVSRERPDLPEDGLPLSLLGDLMGHIPCDFVGFQGYDTGNQSYWFSEGVWDDGSAEDSTGDEPLHEPFWANYWACEPCSYPDVTGDLRPVHTIGDFYSARQWHSTGMFCDVMRPQGFEHMLKVALPEPPGSDASPGRSARLFLLRGPGPDFTERDRAVLTLLRPHLHQAYLDADRRRRPVPDLTPRQWELLRLMAAGRTNIQMARQLGLSEGTVRTHLENIYSRLDVQNRTAAVMRAFPERVA